VTRDGVGLRVLLAGLAAYHLAIGALAVLSYRRTVAAVRTLYGAALEGGAQLRYAITMLGLYGLAFGFLLSAAAWEPSAHRQVVLAAALLLIGRALVRLTLARQVAASFGVSVRRNRAHACGLLLVAALLIWWLPP
jgi:hypothetical protein